MRLFAGDADVQCVLVEQDTHPGSFAGRLARHWLALDKRTNWRREGPVRLIEVPVDTNGSSCAPGVRDRRLGARSIRCWQWAREGWVGQHREERRQSGAP